MNITLENLDALNAVIKIDISKDDYTHKVDKVLNDYRKTANIPGFRKGHVPMGMIKRQYGKAVMVDEVNKLLQEHLNTYLVDEKLDILGQPLPKMQNDIDWESNPISFEFEIGKTPSFDVSLDVKDAVTKYAIIADEKTIDNQIERIQSQYGKLISQDTIEENSEISGIYENETHEINNNTTLTLDKLANSKTQFLGAKIGDTIILKSSEIYSDTNDLARALNISNEKASDLDVDISFKINEINTRELADLDQELFDKLYGENTIKSVTELRSRLKEDAEKQFEQQADQKLFNDVTEYLIENTTFDLPAEFLEKWIKATSKEDMDDTQAKEEYEKSEKGLRYQLIEAKLIEEHDINITLDNIKDHTKQMVKVQMAQFGNTDPSDKELEDIAARILANKEESKRIAEELVHKQLLDVFKNKIELKTKELNFEDFVKEAYSNN